MKRLPLTRALVVALVVPALASAQVVTPASCDLVLDPGETDTVTIEVCVPGGSASPVPVEVYFLNDSTASMGPVINAVQADAVDLLNQLNAFIPDVSFGVGEYRDFPVDQITNLAFRNLTPMTKNIPDILDGIDTWFPFFGMDIPEAQLYALHLIAAHDVEENIGWSANTQKIVVWFGDSPGHDPVCAAMSGHAHDITRDSVIADLVARDITVIAVDGVDITLFGTGLNASGDAEDYEDACGPGTIPAGQADAITAATGGQVEQVGDAADIKDAIISAINSVVTKAKVRIEPRGAIAKHITNIDPSNLDLTIPADGGQQVCGEIDVTFEGPACQENNDLFAGTIDVILNGAVVHTKDVTITQPSCSVSQCLLFAGFAPAYGVLPGGEREDTLLAMPTSVYPVLLNKVPVFHVPNDPVYDGLNLYFQVVMFNPFQFPDDPVKSSNGVHVQIGRSAVPYGTGSGMAVDLARHLAHEPDHHPSFAITSSDTS